VFKQHINSHFRSCRQIAKARDEHRQRDVKLFLLPGRFDFIGVSDGVDAWVCPVEVRPFNVDTARILADIQAGKPGPTFDEAHREPRRRAKLVTEQQQPTTTTRKRNALKV
jgi:hypothetical protein